MISKKHFAAQVKKLNTIFPDSAISNEQAILYYETLSPDFTDTEFDVAINNALKTSFKFPPIAAFYRKEDLSGKPDKFTEIMRGVI